MTAPTTRSATGPTAAPTNGPARDGLLVALAPLPTPRGNPYVRQLADRLVGNGCTVVAASPRSAARADVLHLQWPDHFVNRDSRAGSVRGALKVLLMCALVRVRRRAVVWTVHNLAPHDARHPGVERWFWPLFLRSLTGAVYLTAAGRATAERTVPGLRRVRWAVVPHGSYEGVYPPFEGTPDEARERLAIRPGAAPVAFFGQVRAYKNVPGLLDAFAGVDDPQAVLVVAGTGPDAALQQRIAQAAHDDPRVLPLGRVADDDVAVVMTAVDGLVLPYREVFNSGSLVLALSFGRPALVPRTDVFAEVRSQVGDDWVRMFDPPLTPAHLEEFAAQAAALLATGASPDLSALDWDRLGAQLVAFYRTLGGGREAR